MTEQAGMNWRAFTIRLIEALRWPVAFVIVFVLLRSPIAEVLEAIARQLID